MKKLIAMIMPLFFVTGCISFPVVMEKDPFRGVSVVTADMWHSVVEGDVDNLRALYRKDIKNGEVSDPVVSFVFVTEVNPYGTYYGEGLKPEGYILADGKSFKVVLSERNNVKRVTYPPVYDVYPMWYPYYFRGVIIRTVTRHVLTAKLTLTPDIQGAILTSRSYHLRFFLGDNPITLEATPKQLESVKKFLEAGIAPGK